MFELTKKTDYGLELMVALAKNYKKGAISLRRVALTKRLSFKFLEQVAIPLRQHGLIGAKEGKGGGYFLKQAPGEIPVMKIIEATEGGVHIKNCLDCGREKICRSRGIWRDLEKKLYREISQKKLLEFL